MRSFYAKGVIPTLYGKGIQFGQFLPTIKPVSPANVAKLPLTFAHFSTSNTKSLVHSEINNNNEDKKVNIDYVRRILAKQCTRDQYLDSCSRWSDLLGINQHDYGKATDLTNCGSTAQAMLDIIPKYFYHIHNSYPLLRGKNPVLTSKLGRATSMQGNSLKFYGNYAFDKVVNWTKKYDGTDIIILISNSRWKWENVKEQDDVGHAAVLWRTRDQFICVGTSENVFSVASSPKKAVQILDGNAVVNALTTLENVNEWTSREYLSWEVQEHLSMLGFIHRSFDHVAARPQFTFTCLNLQQYGFVHP